MWTKCLKKSALQLLFFISASSQLSFMSFLKGLWIHRTTDKFGQQPCVSSNNTCRHTNGSANREEWPIIIYSSGQQQLLCVQSIDWTLSQKPFASLCPSQTVHNDISAKNCVSLVELRRRNSQGWVLISGPWGCQNVTRKTSDCSVKLNQIKWEHVDHCSQLWQITGKHRKELMSVQFNTFSIAENTTVSGRYSMWTSQFSFTVRYKLQGLFYFYLLC